MRHDIFKREVALRQPGALIQQVCGFYKRRNIHLDQLITRLCQTRCKGRKQGRVIVIAKKSQR